MNLSKNGRLISSLRKAKGMTQKQVADMLGVLPKTVSKWETGHGFPDVSTVSDLAKILGVSSDTILSGNLNPNTEEVGNMKKTKFYVCPNCGAVLQGTGECSVVCCGKSLEPLMAAKADNEHEITVSQIENDYYITFEHEMTKEHYIGFIAYVTYDRVLLVRLYPEQDSAVRFSKMYGGNFYYYCNKHGFFEYRIERKKQKISEKKGSLTSLMSAFARAYHFENSKKPVFSDSVARQMFADAEYEQMKNYIKKSNENIKEYVNEQLAPTPIARARFCEDSLETAVKTGTQQYVILGCGLDTFSQRNKNDLLNIFEIDREETIDDKKRRIERAGLKFPDNVELISADLSKEKINEVLVNNGFDRNKKTLFSCLGLLYYMTFDEIEKLLSEISQIAAEGSTVVFDFADNHLFSSDIPRVKEMLKMAEESKEPMKACFSFGELEKLLEAHNFLIYEHLNDNEIQNKYFKSCDNELTAFEHINLILAVLKK